MSVLLIVVGAVIAVLGLGMAGYGIPVKEFSFGNTLILAGSMAFVGGFVIVAIGAMIGQLQRIAAMLAARPPLQAGRLAEPFESVPPQRAVPQPPIPFPERPKPAAAVNPAPPPAAPLAVDQPAVAAPTLRNPDAPPSLVEQFEIPVHEDVSLSPPAVPAPGALSENEPLPPPPAPARTDRIFPPPPPQQHRPEPPPAFADEPWVAPPPRTERQAEASYFDTMWPADSRTPRRPGADDLQAEPKPMPPAAAAPEMPGEPVAILKSGVVDGMAYTLYVDGSIEAELPHGTLRFASINELRDHLAKSA